MAANDQAKKNAWVNIYRLVKPYKKTFMAVFVISFLATAVTLVTPLIYREAINDIAGLFLQQARNDVESQAGLETVQEDLPGVPFIEKLIGRRDTSRPLVTTTYYTYDTLHLVKDTTILKRVRHKKTHGRNISVLRRIEKIPESRIIKQPHTQTSVAPRTPRQAFTTLVWAVILLFIINILGLIFWWVGENMNVRVSCTIERKFINRTFGHVLRLPLSFFVKRSSAALQKQIDQSQEISNTVTYLTKDIFPEIISLVGIIAIMLWQNPILALLALSIVPFYILLTIRSTRKLEMSLSGYYEKWEEVSARMQDALTGIKTVKLSGAEEREMERLDQQAGKAYKDYMQRAFLSKKYSFWQILLTHLATTMVLCYGGYLALHHELTPGDVVMFVAYLDLLYAPIDNLASLWAEIQQNVTSVSRAFRLLDTKVVEEKFDELHVQHGRVEFRNVDFGYTPERQILHHLSFTADPGKITALVGKSGAGKTTTVDLLLKLFEPQDGEIFIDGQKLSAVDEASVRKNIGVV
ncbi:MAG TPA: ABC transporter ATP-binding protein, partial [Chitinophagaceae bacterium]|nr:ABC transporter ATP-binding protein [Chitinophagaceae bacterium]